MVTVTVAGLADPGSAVSTSRVTVRVGGVDHGVNDVSASGNLHLVTFLLLPLVPGGPQISLSVGIDGRFSAPVPVPIQK
jgi:hypothetical protein